MANTFVRMLPKSTPQYQQLDHCTALWDYFNKGTHASIKLDRLLVLFHYTTPAFLISNEKRLWNTLSTDV